MYLPIEWYSGWCLNCYHSLLFAPGFALRLLIEPFIRFAYSSLLIDLWKFWIHLWCPSLLYWLLVWSFSCSLFLWSSSCAMTWHLRHGICVVQSVCFEILCRYRLRSFSWSCIGSQGWLSLRRYWCHSTIFRVSLIFSAHSQDLSPSFQVRGYRSW